MRRHELFQLARVKASCEIHQKAFKYYGDAGNDIIWGENNSEPDFSRLLSQSSHT